MKKNEFNCILSVCCEEKHRIDKNIFNHKYLQHLLEALEKQKCIHSGGSDNYIWVDVVEDRVKTKNNT